MFVLFRCYNTCRLGVDLHTEYMKNQRFSAWNGGQLIHGIDLYTDKYINIHKSKTNK